MKSFFCKTLGIYQQKDVPLQKGSVVQRIEQEFPKHWTRGNGTKKMR